MQEGCSEKIELHPISEFATREIRSGDVVMRIIKRMFDSPLASVSVRSHGCPFLTTFAIVTSFLATAVMMTS